MRDFTILVPVLIALALLSGLGGKIANHYFLEPTATEQQLSALKADRDYWRQYAEGATKGCQSTVKELAASLEHEKAAHALCRQCCKDGGK